VLLPQTKSTTWQVLQTGNSTPPMSKSITVHNSAIK